MLMLLVASCLVAYGLLHGKKIPLFIGLFFYVPWVLDFMGVW